MPLARPLLTQVSSRLFVLTAITLPLFTDTCLAYRLVGSESLSAALVANHYTINDRLDAVIVVDPTMPTFEYQTFYAMGYADEPEGQQGRLHFLEHIIEGVGSDPPGVLAELIGSNGGESHAATGVHMTYFTMKFPKGKLALAVEIDRDRFYRTLFDNEFIDNEKQVVLTELSRNSTRTRRRFSRQFWGLVYGRSNFDGLGTAAFIDKIETGDLRQFFHNVLRRKKRLVVVIGDVEVNDVLTKLAEAFPDGDHPGEDRPALSRFPNPDVLGERYRVRFKSPNRTRFKKAWPIPALGHPDYASFCVLASILTRPSYSLRSSLVDSKVVNSFSAWASSLRGFGLMGFDAETDPVRSIKPVENAISSRLDEIRTQGITESELAAGRNIQLRKRYSQLYSRSEIAQRFGSAFVEAGDPLRYPRLIRQIRRVNADDIQRIVGEHLIDANSITLSWTLEKKHPLWVQIVAFAVLILAIGATVFVIVWTVRKAIQRFSVKAVCNEQPPENHI